MASPEHRTSGPTHENEVIPGARSECRACKLPFQGYEKSEREDETVGIEDEGRPNGRVVYGVA